LKLSLARLYSDSVYCDRAWEFKDPNFAFSESCTKKNALTKLARMSRVRHNAKSIQNRYNSLKMLTKLFEIFCPLTKGRHFEKNKLGLLRNSLIFYFVAIDRNPLSEKNASRNLYSSGTLGHRVPQRVIRPQNRN
jgi:dGTP triphosphohydrolase